MGSYSPVFKKEIVEKILTRKDKSLEQAIRESGISRATVYRWLKQCVADPHGLEVRVARPQDWSCSSTVETG
jgi:transposase-like protein